MEWQPIKTCPKDGTVVVFATRSDHGKFRPIIARADDLQARPWWLQEATHWMPIPKPRVRTEQD
jgi:hypothetical protein